MMEGFGVHTFRFVNAKGVGRFVKFHWKPLLGVHSLLWDEAQKISGLDPDFHRRDLWEAIEAGQYPEWELGVQIVEEKDEQKFDFDLLDPTKLIPEELVPVVRIGKMTLDRNPDNFLPKPNRWRSIPATSFPASISRTIRCYKVDSSHIRTLNSFDWADRTSMRFPSIDRWRRCITINATAICGRRSIPGR